MSIQYRTRWLLVTLLTSSMASAQQTVSTLTSSFQASGDIAVTAEGDILVADFGVALNNSNGTQVFRVTPDGQRSVFASGFAGASGNEIGPDGLLYQSSIGGNRVSRVEADGSLTTVASSGLSAPVGLAFNAAGDLFVANCGNSTISRVDNAGNVSQFSNSTLLSCPNGMTADDENNLYAVNFNNGNIIKLAPDGTASLFATTPGGPSKPSGGNGHIVFDRGMFYLVSNARHQVFSLSLAGELTVIAGSGQQGRADGDALSASFSLPNGIGISPDGTRLYVNDSQTVGSNNQIGPNVVRVITLPKPQPEDIVPNDGLTGSWFDPNSAGQGLLIDIRVSIDLFFAAWFTFDDASLGEQRWLTAQGSLGSNGVISVPIFSTSGGVFDDPASTESVQVGQLEIRFTSCTTAVANYLFEDGASGLIELQRLTADIYCQGLLDPG